MGFEYDPEKSAENKRKHGVDFEEVQALWSDPALLEIPARVNGRTALGGNRENAR